MKGMVISKSAVVRRILRGVLYSVDVSEIVLLSSGAEGFEAIKTEAFDIVLLDNCLSDVGVLDLIRELRLHANRIVIFIFGAEKNKDFVLETIRAGATGFIIRPFKRPVVSNRIRRALIELN